MADETVFDRARRRRIKNATLDPTIKKDIKWKDKKGNFVPTVKLDPSRVDDRRYDGLVEHIIDWFVAEGVGRVKALPGRLNPFPTKPKTPAEVQDILDSFSPKQTSNP